MKRLNKTKGMYALLITVAAVIGITIYGSCSADDDYDNYSSDSELFTLADGEMSLRSDVGGGNPTLMKTNLRSQIAAIDFTTNNYWYDHPNPQYFVFCYKLQTTDYQTFNVTDYYMEDNLVEINDSSLHVQKLSDPNETNIRLKISFKAKRFNDFKDTFVTDTLTENDFHQIRQE